MTSSNNLPMITSPIEQFWIYPIIEIRSCLEGIYFYPYTRMNQYFYWFVHALMENNFVSFTNNSVFLLLPLIITVYAIVASELIAHSILNSWVIMYVLVKNFTNNTVLENIGVRGFVHAHYILLLFVLISFLNIFGMIPYTYTITSQLVVTLTFAGCSFIGANSIAFKNNGVNFFGSFLPSGTPVLIVPFLVIVEFISYIARVFSPGIRLFANMMAGHTLLKILASYTWPLLYLLSVSTAMVFLVPFSPVRAITCLEFAIAFMQAYVFTIPTCIYINDVYGIDH